MKRNHKVCSVSITLFLCAAFAGASIIYDVTFEYPPHVAGSPPVTTFSDPYLSDRPYDQSGFVVSNGVAGFGSHAAVVVASGYQFISLYSGLTYATGIHKISWDWELLAQDESEPLQAAFDIGTAFGAGSALFVRYGLDQTIVVDDPLIGLTNIGTYAIGQVYAFTALLNMDTDSYDIFVDGNQVISSQTMEPDDAIGGAGVIRPFGAATIAVDNLRWEIVPEPSTWLLLVIGFWGLCGRRLVRTRTAER